MINKKEQWQKIKGLFQDADSLAAAIENENVRQDHVLVNVVVAVRYRSVAVLECRT